MSEATFIERELSVFAKAHDEGGLWAVQTHCLYPGNSAVTVFVSGGSRECVVSDNGGAVDQLTERGILVKDPNRFLHHFCRERGLSAQNGKIVSPVVPADALPTAIVMVANTASTAAHWGVENLKVRQRRDIKKLLLGVLQERYSAEYIRSHVPLTGASTRSYSFEHLVPIDGRILVVDSVVPEASAINAKTIAHLDLAKAGDARFIQRIVYDESDHWRAADLNLMKIAAPLVALGQFGLTLDSMKGKPTAWIDQA